MTPMERTEHHFGPFWEKDFGAISGGPFFSWAPLVYSGPVITKGVFSMEKSLESLKSLNSLESLENGRNLLSFPQSGGSLESLDSLESLENRLF